MVLTNRQLFSGQNESGLPLGNTKVVKIFLITVVLWQLYQIGKYTGFDPAVKTGDELIVPTKLPPQNPTKIDWNRGKSNASSTPDVLRESTKTTIIESVTSKAPTPTKVTTLENVPSTTTTTTIIENATEKELTSTSHSQPDSKLSSAIWAKIRNECFGINSDPWITGDIASNNAANITSELLDTLIEGPTNFLKLSSLFDQTICHEDSSLRNFSPQNELGSTNFSLAASTEDWYQRFLFLALHWKFHKPALEEYKLRKSCAKNDETNVKSFMDQQMIQAMDFECPEAKFIVIPVGSVGFGAYLNTMASLSILLALRTDRIPIFTSKSFFPWQRGDTDPWLLAPTHCERKDLQCYFLPMSPCTVTIEELEAAPIYGSNRKEQKFLAQNLAIPPELESNRIVVLNSGLTFTPSESLEMREIASAAVEDLLGEWKKAQVNDGKLSNKDSEAMDLASKWVTEKFNDDPTGLLRQVYVYMLRPNPHYKQILDRQASQLVPQNLNPSETIGLAIRGSDKCLKESMCLSFDRYMEVATDVAYPFLPKSSNNNTRPKLIMTTEDPQVFNKSLAYQRNASFPFEFLVNENDNMQGSGYPKDFHGEGESTIVSSLTALKFHFNAGRVYLNCCSNFHAVLNRLLQGQCGASRHRHDFVFGKNISDGTESVGQSWPTQVAQCMNQEDFPSKFRICCGWSKDKVCKERMKEYFEEKANKTSI